MPRVVVDVDRHICPTCGQMRGGAPEEFTKGDFKVYLLKGYATVDGSVIQISPTEWLVLLALAKQPNRPVASHNIAREVWGYADMSARSNLRVQISRLRKKGVPITTLYNAYGLFEDDVPSRDRRVP